VDKRKPRIKDALIVKGALNRDSHDYAAFFPLGKIFLEDCAAIVGGFIEKTESTVSKW
jgi:hypothetical protein